MENNTFYSVTLALGYHQKSSYRVLYKSHLDTTTTTRGHPNGVCGLGMYVYLREDDMVQICSYN